MSRPKRYQFHPIEEGIQPPPATDDIDEALVATAVAPLDVWDTEWERYLSPIKDPQTYREILHRVNEKRRGSVPIRYRWGNVAFVAGILVILGYCSYILAHSPLEP